MNRRVTIALLCLSLLTAGLSACGTPAATATETPVATESVTEPTTGPATEPADTDEAAGLDYAGLVAALEAAGASVEAAGEVEQPFFGPKGQVIKVNGADVQVFEYPEFKIAASAAEEVSSDGSSIGTHSMMWMAAPHFYTRGKLIVLYIGEEAEVTSLLTGTLGPQFAGR